MSLKIFKSKSALAFIHIDFFKVLFSIINYFKMYI